MADREAKSGISLVDAVLLMGAGAVVVVVAFFLLNVLAGIIWFAIKAVVVVAVVAFLGWLVLRKSS
jgi:hypothetical protein